jgi:hypothetical protein
MFDHWIMPVLVLHLYSNRQIVSILPITLYAEPWWLRGLIEHTQFLTLMVSGFETRRRLWLYMTNYFLELFPGIIRHMRHKR